MAESGQLQHHQKQEFCETRPAYRDGRKLRAVKVYTINDESRYLIVQGVPAVGASQELLQLCALYGRITEYRILDEYPTADQFTDVFWIKYEQIQSARVAKRKLDDRSFFGGVLHVCYAPECESVEETREKLVGRRKAIAAKCREYGYDSDRVTGTGESGQAPEVARAGLASWHPGKELSSSDSAHAEAKPVATETTGARRLHAECGNSTSEAPRTSAARGDPGLMLGLQLAGELANYPSTECYPHEWPPMPLHLASQTSTTIAEVKQTAGDATKAISAPAAASAAAAAAAWHRNTFSGSPCVRITRPTVAVHRDATLQMPRTVKVPQCAATECGVLATTGSNPVEKLSDSRLGTPAQLAAGVQTAAAIVRPYRPSTSQPPKFVPRQAAGRGPTRTGDMATVGRGCGSLGDAEIKLNAAVLGKLQGPALPRQAAAQGGLYASTLTGRDSLDKSVFDTRRRIREIVSAVTEASTAKVKKSQQESAGTGDETQSTTEAKTNPCI